MALLLPTLVVLALLQALLLWLWTYENTRFFRSRLRAPLPPDFAPRAHLFLPCKGVEPRFVDTVRGMLGQDYPDYRVTFVVESVDDPAHDYLLRLIDEPRTIAAELIVAGPALDCGQKVHNLLTATRQLDDRAEVVVFADSDILPDSQWLQRLVGPLSREKNGVVTGYRWFYADDGSWAGTLLAALNASVTFSLGNHPWNQVWGGSWAIRRSRFEELCREGLWAGALTEDLQVSRFVRERGQYVAFEPGCLVASPVHGPWLALAEFARRQYLITRVYAPRFWWLGCLATLFAQGTFWSTLCVVVVGAWHGESWPMLSGLLTLTYGIHTHRAMLRQRAIEERFKDQLPSQRVVAWLDRWAHPVLGLLQLALIGSSAVGRTVTWRSIRYRLHGPHRTEILRPQIRAGVGSRGAALQP